MSFFRNIHQTNQPKIDAATLIRQPDARSISYIHEPSRWFFKQKEPLIKSLMRMVDAQYFWSAYPSHELLSKVFFPLCGIIAPWDRRSKILTQNYSDL